jgi:hypothetical protein
MVLLLRTLHVSSTRLSHNARDLLKRIRQITRLPQWHMAASKHEISNNATVFDDHLVPNLEIQNCSFEPQVMSMEINIT